jgi:hypothetical protein
MTKFIIKAAISALIGLLVTYGVHSMIVRWRNRKFDLKEEMAQAQQAATDTAIALKTFVEQQGTRITNATAEVRATSLPAPVDPDPVRPNEDREKLRKLLETVRKSQAVLQQEKRQP